MFEDSRLRKLCAGYDLNISNALETQAPTFGINLQLRRAHFLGQIAYESDYLRVLEENLNYSAPRIGDVWPRLVERAQELQHNPEALGNAAYANKNGNGDEASGDGYKYRGRGLIQLTGRANYVMMDDLIGAQYNINLVDDPDQATRPLIAVTIAMTFWQQHGCNALADLNDYSGITRKINGGQEGLLARKLLTDRARDIFV